ETMVEFPEEGGDIGYLGGVPYEGHCREGFYNGIPSISFSIEDEEKLESKLGFSAVGRFHKDLHLSVLKLFLLKLGFGAFKIRRINSKDVLFTFKAEEDYIRFVRKHKWYVYDTSFYVFKWTRDYNPRADSPIFPVWVSLDPLPLHLIDYQALFSIASLLGRPVKMDDYTVNRDRREGAKICIELDLSVSPPPKLHIRMGGKDFFTNCTYEDKPLFCNLCSLLGHKESQHNHAQKSQDTGNLPSGKVSGGTAKGNGEQWQTVKNKKTKVQLQSQADRTNGKTLQHGPKKFEWKVKNTKLHPNRFSPLNLMDNTVTQLGPTIMDPMQQESPSCQLLDLQPLVSTSPGEKSSSFFPSLQEAREYFYKKTTYLKDKPQQVKADRKNTPFMGSTYSLDDCLHNLSPEKGLAMLVEELQHSTQTEEEENHTEMVRHSDDDEVEYVRDSSELKPQSFKIPEANAIPISAPRRKKNKKDGPLMTIVTRSHKGHKDFNKYYASSNNKIWVFWSEIHLTLSNIEEDVQWVNCDLMDTITKENLRITTVYGRHTGQERRELWAGLVKLIPMSKWIVGGDFNTVADYSEHDGKNHPNARDMEEFKACISSCGLTTPHTIGSLFTWSSNRSNGRVMRRLDRVLVNNKMLEEFEDISIMHLSKTSSDHKPLLLQCKKEPLGGLKPFRFLDAWLNHPTFLKVVTDSWDKTNQHGGMEGLARKLKELKGHIKERNTKTFGNIFSKLKGAEQTAIQAQENFEKDPSPANREQENKAKAQLILATDYELSYWKQKANIKWMEEGDCNSKFFHAFVKGRRAKNQIRRIVDIQGKEHTDREVIHNMAIDYYNNLFNSKKDIVTTPVLDYLETVITQEDNAKLSKIPTAEEIREAVWSINPNSAPGPDGFNGSFFRAAWHIIQNDVISATQEFFIGINLPKSYGSTFLSLIPKIDNPKSFGDYRPISLSTFMSKVNTRILADRIQQLLPKIISSEQTGFQTGMGVDEQILLVEEMVHKIDSKIRGGNVIIKLDMAKAFDNLEWDYIQGILKKLGFSEHNQGLLLANLRGTHISIMINGSPK
ncbi:unnamed protein product, partial [Cuscuta campestris]